MGGGEIVAVTVPVGGGEMVTDAVAVRVARCEFVSVICDRDRTMIVSVAVVVPVGGGETVPVVVPDAV